MPVSAVFIFEALCPICHRLKKINKNKIIRANNDLCVKESRGDDLLPDIRIHDLRHTAATLLLGMTDTDIETVSHRMGHSKASVTLNIYGHWLEETDAKAADAMGQLLG